MISERERAAIRRTFDPEDVAEIEAGIQAGDLFIALDRDGSARIVLRSGDVLGPVEEPEECEA